MSWRNAWNDVYYNYESWRNAWNDVYYKHFDSTSHLHSPNLL